MIFTMFSAFAEFERSRMKSRQRVGIEKAKSEGKYKGAKKRFDNDQIKEMKASGMKISEIVKELGCSRMTVSRALNS